MHNRFVIVGPQSDPAGVKGMTDASAALREIARQRATVRFARRQFRHACGRAASVAGRQRQSEDAQRQLVSRDRPRHGSDGADGGAAQRLHADRPRHLAAAADRAASRILVDGDPQLFNPYEIILVNPANHPHVNVAAATAFIDWLAVARKAGPRSASHHVNGEQLFVPAPGPTN